MERVIPSWTKRHRLMLQGRTPTQLRCQPWGKRKRQQKHTEFPGEALPPELLMDLVLALEEEPGQFQ